MHHLFLIDDDAVSLGENAFEFGVRVLDCLQPILAAAEQRNIVHRPRAIQRANGDDVAEVAWLHARQSTPHAFGFKLEHTDGIAPLEQSVRLLVVPFQSGQID